MNRRSEVNNAEGISKTQWGSKSKHKPSRNTKQVVTPIKSNHQAGWKTQVDEIPSKLKHQASQNAKPEQPEQYNELSEVNQDQPQDKGSWKPQMSWVEGCRILCKWIQRYVQWDNQQYPKANWRLDQDVSRKVNESSSTNKPKAQHEAGYQDINRVPDVDVFREVNRQVYQNVDQEYMEAGFPEHW